MKIIGSQNKETLKESGMSLVERGKGYVILQDQTGKKEYWGLNNHHAGYTIEVYGHGYEFCRSINVKCSKCNDTGKLEFINESQMPEIDLCKCDVVFLKKVKLYDF